MHTRFSWILLVVACKSSAPAEDPKLAWTTARAETAGAIATLRTRLLAVKAAIDKTPDPKAFESCKPSPTYRYQPTGANHTLDFITYPGLTNDGQPDRDGRAVETLQETSLSRVLWWTGSKGLGYPENNPTSVKRLKAVTGLTTVVVLKERAGSTGKDVRADSFVATLEPPAIVCVLSIDARGELEGTAEQKMVETTYNRKTGETISTREFTEGGKFQGDASRDARQAYELLAFQKLGVTPAKCQLYQGTTTDCARYPGTRCVDEACVLDTK